MNRGKWVMNELLCQTIPAPPPGVEIELEQEAMTGLTLRQRLEKHREAPSCAACHSLMDPIGFGLEEFDAVGAYRETDEGSPIDAAGTLPDGRQFSGAVELSQLIAEDPAFASCVTKKVYTYALGRAPEKTPGHLDTATLDALKMDLVGSGYDFKALVRNVVLSAPFQQRRGEP